MTESKSHDGETFKQSVRRWLNNYEDLFDRHAASRGRYGWQDILGLHALTNMLVSFCREYPRTAGHIALYYVGVSLAIMILLAIL